MSAVDGLDRWQRTAALAEGHCLVLAGPGSGKTTLLAARASHLLETYPEGALAAVSFTRDSAKELTSRIVNKDRLLSGTFHSLSLRQGANVPGVQKRILDDAGRMHYLRQALRSAGSGLAMDVAASAIDRFKATLAPPPTDSEEALIFQYYQEALKRQGLRDFQDILLDTVRGLRDGSIPPVPVRWLLVDEAQDMDEVQYAWVRAHVEAGILTTLVADDDQSIYGWRHALGYQGLTRFERETGAKRFLLEGNYRSGSIIVNTSLNVVANNPKRFPKNIRPQRDSRGNIEVRAYATQGAEAEAVAEGVRDEPGRWGVLSRTNRRLDLVELTCASRNIPFFRLGAGSFWDHAISSAVLALMDDLVAMQLGSGVDRISPFVDGVSRKDLDAVHQRRSEPENKSLKALLKHAPEWMKLVADDRVSLAMQGISMWQSCALEDRAQAVARPAMAHIAGLGGPLKTRLAWIRRKAREGKVKSGDTQVVLSSLHAAKGLEWPAVWMTGCEDGVLPHVEAALDEERRLFYVGMTRARDDLIISHGLHDAVQSRFITEFD